MSEPTRYRLSDGELEIDGDEGYLCYYDDLVAALRVAEERLSVRERMSDDWFARWQAAEAENKRLREALHWVAMQPCTHDAEFSDENTPCSETGACITEWCLSCYARAALSQTEDT